MAYKTSSASFFDSLRAHANISGRGKLFQGAHPFPGIYVVCAKHPGVYIPVDVYTSANALEAMEFAFDSCAGCLNDASHASQWANTRFPEGSEL